MTAVRAGRPPGAARPRSTRRGRSAALSIAMAAAPVVRQADQTHAGQWLRRGRLVRCRSARSRQALDQLEHTQRHRGLVVGTVAIGEGVTVGEEPLIGLDQHGLVRVRG